MPELAFLAARFRVLRRASPEARFFAGRLLDARVARCERGFDGMIPLTVAGRSMA
jgi:hypothetical protein